MKAQPERFAGASIPDALYQKIKKISDEGGLRMQFIFKQALEQWLATHNGAGK